MRLLLVVEGKSEELFANRVLRPHLAERGVYLSAMQVLRGGRARGGGTSWQPWRDHLHGVLRREPRQGVFVSTMLDLYRVPKDTPGWSPPSGDGCARAEAMLAAMRAAFDDDSRFAPYLQVHEFEALLFAELSALARVEPEVYSAKQIEKLAKDVAHLEPEAIDEGDETAPSKRLNKAFSLKFDKIDHGVPAVEAIGLPTLRSRCPRFDAWVSKLESLSGSTT